MKYIINKIKKTVFGGAVVLLAGFAMTSCQSEFEEMNTDPTAPTDEMLAYDNFTLGGFIPQLQKAVFATGSIADDTGPINLYQVAFQLNADYYSGFMAACINTWGGGVNTTTYDFDNTGWNDASFEAGVEKIYGPWMQIEQNKEKSPEVFAMAEIIKITALQMTTDKFGPIPYSQIGHGKIQVPYDAQDKVYETMFRDLESAIDVLSQYAATSATMIKDNDFVYFGNVSKWIKFANSLMLRMAIRVSYADEAMAKKYAEQAVNNRYGVMTEKDDVAQLASSPKFSIRNPFPTLATSYNETRTGATIVAYMNGYTDPRRSTYFEETTVNGVKGYYGVRGGIPTSSNYRALASKPLFADNSPMVWMRASEVYFLRAEGAIRGWNMKGAAKDLYEQGVTMSFSEHNANMNAVKAYLNNSIGKPANYTDATNGGYSQTINSTITVKWDEAADFEKKLERIITQKYIALYPNGMEAWSEFRRTAYPAIFPIINNTSGGKVSTEKQIRRIPYPLDEYKTNDANVKAAVALLGGPDTGGTNLWWDKKNK